MSNKLYVIKPMEMSSSVVFDSTEDALHYIALTLRGGVELGHVEIVDIGEDEDEQGKICNKT